MNGRTTASSYHRSNEITRLKFLQLTNQRGASDKNYNEMGEALAQIL